MPAALAFLALLMQPGSNPPQVRHVDFGPALAGRDFLLVQAAARHPAMRGRDLACYRIHVYDDEGGRRVVFLGPRKPPSEENSAEGVEIAYYGSDPKCRTIGFVMDARGRVARVIHSRH